MAQRILVVDDERPLADVLRDVLRREGYQVDVAYDGAAALERFRVSPPELAIVDVMLPEVSGFELTRIFRAQSGIPIILLTAKGEEEDKIAGLDLGADDYITKPFSLRELLARVRAALRRHDPQAAGLVTVGDLSIDLDRHLARVDGRALELSPKELSLLHVLAANPGWVMTRERLLERVWGYSYLGMGRTVDVHVSWLRRKLREAGSAVRIETVRGVGYRLEPPG